MASLPDVIAAGRKVYDARVYNTCSWGKRCSVNAPQRVERYDKGNDPNICCMTGFTDPDQTRGRGYIFAHTEDYDQPLWWHPVSRKTHASLHARFHQPRRWCDWVAEHYVHGAWFTMLSMNPVRQWPGSDRSFYAIYPSGLPDMNDTWTDYADQMGITKELFTSSDLRDVFRALWHHPVREAKPDHVPGFGVTRIKPRQRLLL